MSRSSSTEIRPLPRHKDFHRYGFDDVSNLLGTPVPEETPTENATRASRLSDWAMLKCEVRGANSSECLSVGVRRNIDTEVPRADLSGRVV